MNNKGHKDAHHQRPEQGHDGPGLQLKQVGDMVIVLHKKSLVNPGQEDGNQDGGGDYGDNEDDGAG